MLKMLEIAARRAMLAVLLLPGAVSAADELNLEEGYWDTTVIIRVQGGILPVPVIRSSKCITHQDPLPNSTQPSQRCQVSHRTIVGNDVSWRIECADEKGKMVGDGKITYAGKKFEGGMDVSITEIGGDRHLNMRYDMHGERVGACGVDR